MADDDTLPPNPDAKPRRSPLVCEFCENHLTPSGELVGRLSTKARELRDQGDKLERADAALAESRALVETLRGEIATLKAAATGKPAGDDKEDW